MWPGSIPWCPVAGQGPWVKHGRVSETIKNTRCGVKVPAHWYRWSREAAESPYLETFKRYLDMGLSSWLQVAQL